MNQINPDTVKAGDKVRVNTIRFDFEPTGIRHGEVYTVDTVLSRPSGGVVITLVERLGRSYGFEWFDEAADALAVGTRVRVTDAHTIIGGPKRGQPGTFVGATGIVSHVYGGGTTYGYKIDFDPDCPTSKGTWTREALDVLDEGDRSRAVEEMKQAVKDATKEIEAANRRIVTLQGEIAALKDAAAAERRRLTAQIDYALGVTHPDGNVRRALIESFRTGYDVRDSNK